MTDHVQTKSEIRALLEAAGLRPRKRFGQSFLIDGNLMRRLVACADIEPEDVVLEVGGGWPIVRTSRCCAPTLWRARTGSLDKW